MRHADFHFAKFPRASAPAAISRRGGLAAGRPGRLSARFSCSRIASQTGSDTSTVTRSATDAGGGSTVTGSGSDSFSLTATDSTYFQATRTQTGGTSLFESISGVQLGSSGGSGTFTLSGGSATLVGNLSVGNNGAGVLNVTASGEYRVRIVDVGLMRSPLL